MNAWANFFVAIAGAAAALTGLIFVGVSISLKQVLEATHLTGRALESLFLLMTNLFAAMICLMPSQSSLAVGIELGILSVFIWILTLVMDVRMLRAAAPALKLHYRRNMVFSQLAMLPYIAGSIAIMNEGFTGLFWLVPGIIFSFIKALMDAWVLLVEIHR
jgi:modulator of FtsH protease